MGVLAFFTGPLGRIAMYAIGALLGAGALVGVYLNWKHSVENAAKAEFNTKQLESVIAGQNEFIRQSGEITKSQQLITDQLAKQNELITQKNAAVEEFLNSKEAQAGDRPASSVLKETIRRLKK